MAEIISVSALNKYVKSILESDEALADIAIRGEISNFVRNFKTGHCYFSLKDEKANVRVVMFRTDAQNLSFSPENGMQVVARGRISLYERDGAFQIYSEHLFLDGEGGAQQAFLQLKSRLEKDGLFSQEHKMPLPKYPKNVGIVSSKTGAALQDILQVARRRYPLVTFILAPVSVQGQAAVKEIVLAIKTLETSPQIELIIIARGGGSAEDLWVFNSEELARAVFACQVPTISAIGHEIDYTILDFVADLRAPTPSAAAEMALPDIEEIKRQIENAGMNILQKMKTSINLCYNRFNAALHKTWQNSPAVQIMAAKSHLSQISSQLKIVENQQYHNLCTSFKAGVSLAQSLSPYAVLARGYCVAQFKNTTLSSVTQCKAKDHVKLILQDGTIDATVENLIQKEVTGLEKTAEF